jgi:hypothetical protein
MKLSSHSFRDGGTIPGEFAFAVINPANHISLSSNRNPHLMWSDVPEGTKSFVLICHDSDVPSRTDDVNQESREVPASLPRVDFFHWILIDIPATAREIAESSQSDGITPHGKARPSASDGPRPGLNDYTNWFTNDKDMQGDYYGYDGPAPPWNDELMHHYVFTLYAVDVPHLKMRGQLTGVNVRAALAGHVLEKATLVGTYSLNPRVQQS